MPPKKTEAAASKPKSSSGHPTYQDMITDAIVALKDRNGSSRQKLKQYVKTNNNITLSQNMFDSVFNKALKSGVEKGVFQQPKGPSGGTKLAKKTTPAKPAAAKKEAAKPAASTTKKAAPKAAAKPAAKKETAAAKPAAKSAAKPAAKKEAAAKPAAKKAAAPKKAAAKPATEKKAAASKTKTGRVTKKPAAAAPKKAAPKAAPKKKKA